MTTDDRVAVEIATGAGEHLLEHRKLLTDPGLDPKAFKDDADRLAHEFISDALTARFPADAVLSEEGVDSADRLSAQRVWIVDPLDGTREYGEAGRTDWAVHVALVERGTLMVGAVAMPALGRTYTSADGDPGRAESPSPVRIVVSRTRRPEPVMRMAGAMGAELIEMGSAGAKTMAVVAGDADIYAHAGGQYEWDSAAPVAVARAAGLHVSRIDGSELHYNQDNPWLPDLLVCRPELASQALEVLNR